VCCKGEIYKNGVDENGNTIYACCDGDTAENPTHKKASVLDAPNGEETCCNIATYGASPKAYWNGSGAICCKGEIYKNGIDEKGNTIYACCSGDTAENPTYKKVSISEAPNGEEACCEIAIYGESPAAIWSNGVAVCCKNAFTNVQNRTEGTPEKVCCDYDIYGTSPEAYGSGICCASYERFDGDYGTVDACCKGIGETPYCAPGDGSCTGDVCCPKGQSWKALYCPVRWAYGCEKMENGELVDFVECLNVTTGALGTAEQDYETCDCPDGFSPFYEDMGEWGCCAI
ncbi:MAG: hypothetical protein J6U64_02930, partial [Alphaproteobacteria bacterium]|nr:hypothetical protein [Alphaproteobacteria bacterium]